MKDKFKTVHMNVAEQYARLSYAQRRQVGCVIIIDDIVVPRDGIIVVRLRMGLLHCPM